MLFKLTFESVYSELNRQGTAEKYILISVRQSDADAGKAFFASLFWKKLHGIAGRLVVFIPFGGASKPSQWLKYHQWQSDWQAISVARHFRDLPIDTVIGNTTTRAALQSFTTTGPTPRQVFTAVERCRAGGTLLLFHHEQYKMQWQ
jgi:hypothetical protein